MRWCWLWCVALATLFAACTDVNWLARQGIGQAQVLAAAIPIDDVLDQKDLDPVTARRLRLVQAARIFARDQLGLTVGQQYTRVTFLRAPAAVYVVSAAPKTSLNPYVWDYPVVGELPYRGTFDLDEAETLANTLEAQGYDADVRPASTYSLLGILPDPLLSTVLFGYDEASLIETVIHELAHATLFVPGQGAFNEGLATFIGKEGRRQFIARTYGNSSAIGLRMRIVDKDEDAYDRAVSALAFDLRVLFAQASVMTESELLSRKDAIFLQHQSHWQVEVKPTLTQARYRGAALPNNNAALAAYGIYSMHQSTYEQAYRACESSMRCFLSALRQAARGSADPEAALLDWAKAQPEALWLAPRTP